MMIVRGYVFTREVLMTRKLIIIPKTRMRAHGFLCASLFALALATPSFDRASAVDGVQQRQKVNELTHQITWFENMPQALASARQKGKPLVWIHMLGKIDGAT
jgi:hypothetical protein